jgi:hypothetical protein
VNYVSEQLRNETIETIASKDFERIASELCEKALDEARAQLHPLIRKVELDRLDQHSKFVMVFKLALERSIAKLLAAWQPEIETIFRFDVSWMDSRVFWDGTIHLLIKVARVSDAIGIVAGKLDQSLLNYLRQSGWSRFRKSQSVLEIQQVTQNELRHAVSYGAMFCAVYSVPVKIWPQHE